MLAFAAAPAEATPTVIRTGGPSSPSESKVAIVASERNLAGARFRVSEGTQTVLRGRLRRAAGSSAPWAHAYRADLSALRDPGSFRVHAGGKTSRVWTVGGSGSSRLVPHLLRFFRTQRDGLEPALLHSISHLNDAVIRDGPRDGTKIELTGGWMDAGDMIHFTQTTGYSAALLEAAARLDSANRAALSEEADVGIRWLLKAHPFPNVFVVQVGGVVDHNVGFRDPASDDGSSKPGIGTRSAFVWKTKIGGDIGGKVATALALAADREGDSVRKAKLLAAARDWYTAGRAAATATPKIPGTGGFYTYESWKDSLAAGAAALYRTSGQHSFLNQALAYLKGSQRQRYDPLEAGNLAPFAAADICGVLGAPGLGGASARKRGCRFLRDGASSALDNSRENAFAPASYFQWGTTGINGAFGAQAALAARGAGLGPGRSVAAGARDYLFGRNAWGASFVAGFGPNSPRKLHSWGSVFGNGLPDGAVAGGPAPRGDLKDQGFRSGGPLRAFNSDIVYEDRRADYVTSEPAIDYGASCILLLAAL